MKHFALLCFAVLFLAAGCISYQYEGVREAEPTHHVKVYTDATRIRQPYRVLGQATASRRLAGRQPRPPSSQTRKRSRKKRSRRDPDHGAAGGAG